MQATARRTWRSAPFTATTEMLTLLLSSFCLMQAHTSVPREHLLFDRGWRFAFGNSSDRTKDFDPFPIGTTFGYFAKAGGALGAAKPDFDDSKWRKLDLPHDWAVELPFDQKADGDHGFKALGQLFPETSIGWYRKAFDIPATDRGRKLSVDFDGVFPPFENMGERLLFRAAPQRLYIVRIRHLSVLELRWERTKSLCA